MINETIYSCALKCRVTQISKRKARKYWEDGKTIYFHSSNLMFDCIWQHPMPAEKNGFSFVGHSFDSVCDEYMYYNCDSERGKYIHFFVKEG